MGNMPSIKVEPTEDCDSVEEINGDVEEETKNEEAAADEETPPEDPSFLSQCSPSDVLEVVVALIVGLMSAACIVVAIIYINTCVADEIPFLPVWLVIHGIGVLSAMIGMIVWLEQKHKHSSLFVSASGLFILAVVMIIFTILWLIIGNVLVFTWFAIGWRDENPCYVPLLHFTIAIAIFYDICWFIVVVLAIIHTVRARYWGDNSTEEQEVEENSTDKKLTRSQYMRSLLCPINQRLSWQSCAGYSTFILYLLLALISLVVGGIYQHKCPFERLPVWLLVQGLSILVIVSCTWYCRTHSDSLANTASGLVIFFPSTVFIILQVAWLAIGNDWAFNVWRHERLALLRLGVEHGNMGDLPQNISSISNNSSISNIVSDFRVCDHKLHIFYAGIIALLDIPIMVFIFIVVAMMVVLFMFLLSPCFPNDPCGRLEAKDTDSDTPTEEEVVTTDGQDGRVVVNVNLGHS